MHSFVRSPCVLPGLAPLDCNKPVNHSLARERAFPPAPAYAHAHFGHSGKGSKASLIAGGSIGALFVGRYVLGCGCERACMYTRSTEARTRGCMCIRVSVCVCVYQSRLP